MSEKKGRLFIISGPSGAGKSTLIDDVLEELKDFTRSVSVTTRPKRKDEKANCKYSFLSRDEFNKLVSEKKLLECASYCGFDYGTPKEFVENEIAKGKNVILEIEVQGAIQVKEKKKDTFMIFIITPSLQTLKKRLKKRNTESEKDMGKRMDTAKKEMQYQKYYDCIIVNNDYNEALLNLKHVLKTKRAV